MRALLSTLLLTLAAPAFAEEVPQTPLEHELFEVQEGEAVMGDAAAPVTIVEYSSFSCPHCAGFHKAVLPLLKEKYIDTGKAKLVARPFPLNAPALAASKLAACVEGEKRHKFTEVFFKLQEKWAFNPEFSERLKQIAQVGGLSNEAADTCLTDPALEEEILKSRQRAGEELIVQSTPTFFINGEKVVGSNNIEMFSEVIDRKLND